ncbi:MAG: TIGR02147 family protein [Spirochaetia bacterium]|nr:TIGR02147 family protein [Spirochaetia bacterium]
MNDEKKINIFSYLDYRKYLANLFNFYKKEENLTLRLFARRAGLGSHSFLKSIIEGSRSLSIMGALKMAKGFRLNKSETEYLELLVKFSLAHEVDEKNEIYKKITKLKPKDEISKMEEKHYFLFSNWYVLMIRELVTLPYFKEDYTWIAKTLNPPITKKQAKEAIDTLLELKYLIRDKNNKLVQAMPEITTGPEVKSSAVKNFHKNLLSMAARSIDETKAHWRDISALSFTANRQEFDFIKERIVEFRREIIQYLKDSRENNFPEDISDDEKTLYNLNIQLFNATEIYWKKKNKDNI